MKVLKTMTCLSILLLLATILPAQGKPLTLLKNGKTDYVIVTDHKNKPQMFALKEFMTIFAKSSLGVRPVVLDASSPAAAKAKKRIIIGKNKISEKLLGSKLFATLRSEESLVTSIGNDIILTGNGDGWGTLYAVYDFLENELGYRMFSPRLEKIVRTKNMTYSGRETRIYPAMHGYRNFGWQPSFKNERFLIRNRTNRSRYGGAPFNQTENFADGSGLIDKHRQNIPGHGFIFFLPAYDTVERIYQGGKSRQKLKGYFKTNPEYYSLNQNGKRDPRAQVCLSNPAVRKIITEKVDTLIKLYGPGYYMVSSNDFHNTRYCFCKGCMALEKKYDSVGGPLFDYILELCKHVKDKPGVIIHTLAYKGPTQTEKAPKNVKFPDNFAIDYAPVSLKGDYTYFDQPAYKLPNGEMYQVFQNLKEWQKIVKNMTCWFYLLTSPPYALYEKPQADMQALVRGGVTAITYCGGYCTQFADLQKYLVMRWSIDPNRDAEKMVKEFVDFKFGPAANLMMEFIKDVEKNRRDLRGVQVSSEYSSLPVESKRLVRWQKLFDRMEKITAKNKKYFNEVRMVRSAVDAWCLLFYARVKKDCPEYKESATTLYKRGLDGLNRLKKVGENPGQRHWEVFQEMSLYPSLKSEAIPAELTKRYKGNKNIYRVLPRLGMPGVRAEEEPLINDPMTVTGKTLSVVLKKSNIKAKGIPLEFYDWTGKKFHHQNKFIPMKDIVPGKYKLYKVPAINVTSKCSYFIGGWTKARLHLGRFFDPSYQRRKYDVWFSLKFTGPAFDPASRDKENRVAIEQAFLVDVGLDE